MVYFGDRFCRNQSLAILMNLVIWWFQIMHWHWMYCTITIMDELVKKKVRVWMCSKMWPINTKICDLPPINEGKTYKFVTQLKRHFDYFSEISFFRNSLRFYLVSVHSEILRLREELRPLEIESTSVPSRNSARLRETNPTVTV